MLWRTINGYILQDVKIPLAKRKHAVLTSCRAMTLTRVGDVYCVWSSLIVKPNLSKHIIEYHMNSGYSYLSSSSILSNKLKSKMLDERLKILGVLLVLTFWFFIYE